MKPKLTELPVPVHADWKISEVLQRYPQLLAVLVGISPAFRHLRNPVMRRIQSRLVTVAEAAQIAGIEPDALVSRLNEAIGIEPAMKDPLAGQAASTGEEQGWPDWAESVVVAQRLDVRPFQRRGEEPFSAIMEAARKVPLHQALALRNTFEPVPLYDVLGKRGFVHWARQLDRDDWEILFYNTGQGLATVRPVNEDLPSAVSQRAWDAPSATITIDVSELVPPEPMIRILEALERLPAGGSLLVHHVRRPMHLYPRLDELGYRHETREPMPGQVEVLIEKPDRAFGIGR